MLDLSSTKLLYLEDFSLLESEATIQEILGEGGKPIVILDKTIFYPQGGGQPYDTGTVESSSARFSVEEVRFVDGVVKHIGRFEHGFFSKGEAVKCSVDPERRTLHSRIHSAGHIVDMAVADLELPWTPGKGYHFPNGPYVEYEGSLEGWDKDKLRTDIEKGCNNMIGKGGEVKAVFVDKERMRSICRFVPTNIPADKPTRVVLFGEFGIPCGGTHVRNLSEIRSMTIRKVKADDANIRVGYDVAREHA